MILACKDKAPIGRWKPWNGKKKKNQNSIATVIGTERMVVDIDVNSLAQEYHRKLRNKYPSVRTGRGNAHFWAKNTTGIYSTQHFYIGEKRSGEVRTGKNIVIIPNHTKLSLPFSEKYQYINCSYDDVFNSDLPDLDLDDFPFLDLNTHSLDTRVTLSSPNAIHSVLSAETHFDITKFLPSQSHDNNGNMLGLVWGVYYFGLQDRVLDIIEEWMGLNRFLRHSKDQYRADFARMIKSIKPELINPRTALCDRVISNSVTLVSKEGSIVRWKSRQKRIDWIVEELFKELGKNDRQFHFSTRFRYDRYGIEDRFFPQEVSRAIQRLIKNGKAIKKADAWYWHSKKQKVHASEYIYLNI